jgi:chromosome partitioning protein
MDGGILGNIAEFIDKVVELFHAASPSAVIVVIIGSVLVGFIVGIAWCKLKSMIERRSTEPNNSSAIAELNSKIASYSRVIEELEKDDADLWALHAPSPQPQLAERLRASRMKIVLVGHLKGGVSKTTLLANLAAYFDGQGKRVLCIDFDYQGSLTATLLNAAGGSLSPPYSDVLLDGRLSPRQLVGVAETLRPALTRTWLIPAAYTLVRKENQLLIRWLLQGGETDVRFHLAELLLSPEVQNEYDLVLMDMGPRLTTASVSALAAATHLLVPTILDKLSAEAVGSFLAQAQTLTKEMKTGLTRVSVVGTMTRLQDLGDENREAAEEIRKALQKWDGDAQMLSRNIPFKQAFIDCAGRDIASLKNADVKKFFDELGSEVGRRIGL